ncbi:MAG: hypothetical protein AAFN43_01490, partial [Pseudomonadota bacterium]
LNQELSDSISRIDGVVSARVHLMVPETSPFEKNRTPPRASVFIYQEKGVQLREQLPVIKNLIVNSLENLEYANVEVALFDDDSVPQSKPFSGVGNLGSSTLWSLALIILLGGLAWFALNQSSTRSNRRKSLSRSSQKAVERSS